ncbi:hypothetical protein FQN55_007219 [Onygenales sp. PD_40]|nr:hypothetical protein FQN55_007219 [Onygenales sp. PD_40]
MQKQLYKDNGLPCTSYVNRIDRQIKVTLTDTLHATSLKAVKRPLQHMKSFMKHTPFRIRRIWLDALLLSTPGAVVWRSAIFATDPQASIFLHLRTPDISGILATLLMQEILPLGGRLGGIEVQMEYGWPKIGSSRTNQKFDDNDF